MAIFRIVPAGDVRLDGGKVVLLTGAEHVRQKLANRFRWWATEWFLDLRKGIPYRRDVFVKDPDLDILNAMFRRVIRSVIEIADITRFDVALDEAARVLSVEFEVVLVTGETLTVDADDPLFTFDLQEAA